QTASSFVSRRARTSRPKSTSSWRAQSSPRSVSIRSEIPVTCHRQCVTFRRLTISLAIALLWPCAARAQSSPVLRWGGDAEGGAPYVEADPSDPSHVVGFDVDVAQLLASE